MKERRYIYQKFFVLKTILSGQQITLTVKRLAQQVLENHLQLKDTVIIGIQPRGVYLSDQVVDELKKIVTPSSIQYGKLDPSVVASIIIASAALKIIYPFVMAFPAYF